MTEPVGVPLSEDEPRKRHRGRLAVGVGIVAVVAAGAFAVVQLSGTENNPEDPVRELLEAAERGDVLGALEQLAPGERGALREGVVDLVSELERLEVLEGTDLSALSGIDLDISELDLSSEVVGEGLAHVRVEGGSARYDVRADDFPLGDFVRDVVGDRLGEAHASGEDTLELTDPDFLATVERDGRWYVSIAYTVAEAARTNAGVSLADLGDGIAPAGAESPEDAVRALLEAGAELDVERMVALLPPDELGALQEYSALYVAGIREFAEETRQSWEIRLDELSLSSEGDGDVALVTIDDVNIEASDGQTTVTVADGCVRTDFPAPPAGEEDHGYYPEDVEMCPGQNPIDAIMATPFGFGFFFGSTDIEPPEIGSGHPDSGIVVTRVDGEWFVSPTRTAFENLVAVARILDREDLDEVRAYVEEVIASFDEGYSSVSGSVEVVGSAEQCVQIIDEGTSYECEPPSFDEPPTAEEPPGAPHEQTTTTEATLRD